MTRSVGFMGVGLGWLELNARFWRPNLDVPRTFIILGICCWRLLPVVASLLAPSLFCCCVVLCVVKEPYLRYYQSHSERTNCLSFDKQPKSYNS